MVEGIILTVIGVLLLFMHFKLKKLPEDNPPAIRLYASMMPYFAALAIIAGVWLLIRKL